MGCVLRVLTTKAGVDAVLRTSGFRPVAVFRQGMPRAHGTTRIATRSGFNVDVSKSSAFDRQIRDAVRFLTRHASALQRARRIRTVRSFALDFGCEFRSTPDRPWPSFPFPVALTDRAAKHRIELVLSLYADIPETRQDD